MDMWLKNNELIKNNEYVDMWLKIIKHKKKFFNWSDKNNNRIV
jgi:hypothetical protein